MRFDPTSKLRLKQTGSTLAVSLIILILLMLLGVTAMTTSDTQFKLVGNLQFENAAINNAEAAISEAETWLATGTNFSAPGLITATCAVRSVNHLYPLDNTVTPPTPCLTGFAAPANAPLTMNWVDATSLTATTTNNARFIIELLSTNNVLIGTGLGIGGVKSTACGKVNTYRITANGTSSRGATKFVQSYYSVLSC